MLGQEKKLFSLALAIILVLIFIAIFITVNFLLTPRIKGGWISWLLGTLWAWLGAP